MYHFHIPELRVEGVVRILKGPEASSGKALHPVNNEQMQAYVAVCSSKSPIGQNFSSPAL